MVHIIQHHVLTQHVIGHYHLGIRGICLNEIDPCSLGNAPVNEYVKVELGVQRFNKVQDLRAITC